MYIYIYIPVDRKRLRSAQTQAAAIIFQRQDWALIPPELAAAMVAEIG